MKCPECVASGQTSKLYPQGSTSTLMGWSGPYYDEQSEFHSHDPNTVTSGYTCSNGHNFGQSRKRPCPSRGCEHGKTPEQIAEEKKPQCCGGGPQWGHAWNCRTLP